MKRQFCFVYLLRILSIICFIASIIMMVTPAVELLLIRKTDWAQDYEKYKSKSFNLTAEGKSLTEFIKKQTMNRSVKIPEEIFESLKTRLGDKNQILTAAEKKLTEYFAHANSVAERDFFYLEKENAKQTEVLKLNRLSASQFIFVAPDEMAFPWRRSGVLLLAASLLFYFFSPGEKQTSMRYVRFRPENRKKLSDLVAAALVVFFIILGAGISMQTGFKTFSVNWWAINGFCWLLCLPVTLIWLVTGYYRLFSIAYDDERMEITSYFSVSNAFVSLLSKIEFIELEMPAWRKFLFRVASLFASTAPEMKLIEIKKLPGCRLVFSNGDQFEFCLDKLSGVQEFLEFAKDKNIETDELPADFIQPEDY